MILLCGPVDISLQTINTKFSIHNEFNVKHPD